MALAAMVLGAGGCDEETVLGPEHLAGPDTYELPTADTSLDPARLSVGDLIATPCTPLGPAPPDPLAYRHEWGTVDVYFGRATADDPRGAPTPADVALVESHGGRVLYLFNVPVTRARMILSRVPELVEDGFWITVRDVPDPTRYDVALTVGFDRELVDADVDRFAELGGRVTYRFDFIDALAGILPDRSIPDYEAQPDVAYVETEGLSCLAVASAAARDGDA